MVQYFELCRDSPENQSEKESKEKRKNKQKQPPEWNPAQEHMEAIQDISHTSDNILKYFFNNSNDFFCFLLCERRIKRDGD
jgi:hypothetical protein